MKILMWILIAGIPFIPIMYALSMIMVIQHWPAGRSLSAATGMLTAMLLILAWIFAVRSRKSNKGITFDSF